MLIIISILLIILFTILYFKHHSIGFWEYIGGMVISVTLMYLFYLLFSITSSYNSNIITGEIVGKYYQEAYCYEEDEEYDCNCNDEGECDTCERTVKYEQSEQYYLIFSTGYNSNPLEYSKYFSTHGDRLCSSRPKQYGIGFEEGNKRINVHKEKYTKHPLGKIVSREGMYFNPLWSKNNGFFNNDWKRKNVIIDEEFNAYRVGESINFMQRDKRLEEFNRKYQVSLILLYTGNQEEFYTMKVQNKIKNNELILLIDNSKIINVNIWDNESLRTYLMFNEGTGDIYDIVGKGLDLYGFKEKDFKEYSFLEVEFPFWVEMLFYVIIVVIITCLYFLFTNNLYSDKSLHSPFE